ncbi:hypothetical protein KQI84_16385 [bacterium]|nr:hypothetical protein [bacterium]
MTALDTRKALTRLLLAATLAVALAGCQLLAPGSAERTDSLPDLPRASRTVGPGDQVAFHDATFQVMNISPEAEKPVALSVRDGKRSHLLNIELDDYAQSGDFLVYVAQREEARPTEGLLLTLYYLPSLLPKSAQWPIERRMTEKEMATFPGGLVVLNEILDNDFLRTDDDRARLTIFRQNRGLEKVTLVEFHRLMRGDLTFSAGDIFTGDAPGEGYARLRIEKTIDAWPDDLPREELALVDGEEATAFDYPISIEAIQPDIGRVYLTVEAADREADLFLTAGESARWDRLEIRADTVAEDKVALTVFEHAEAVQAKPERLPKRQDSAEQTREQIAEQAATPAVTRKMKLGRSESFAGAAFTLRSIQENSRMDLFDDSATFTIDHDGQLESITLRERERYTLYGGNQWWVIELREATPDPVAPANGEAEVHLETGSFYGMQSR